MSVNAGSKTERPVRSPLLIAFLLLCIAVVSQGVHDVAIEHLGVPYPTLVGAPAWLPVIGDSVRSLFLMLFCLAARVRLDRLPLARAAALIGLLEACLSETFRVAIIDLFLANDWSGGTWAFAAVSLASHIVPWLVMGCLAVLAARIRQARGGLAIVLLAAITSGVLTRLLITPVTKQIAATVLAAAGVSQPEEFFQPPYGPGMLTVIYVTFLEPTIAAFVMAKLSWPGLPPRSSVKAAAFAMLILGASGRITLLLLNSLWVEQPPILAVLSTGQFFAETAVMALLLAWLHSWTDKGNVNQRGRHEDAEAASHDPRGRLSPP